jgi:hypothetical protein
VRCHEAKALNGSKLSVGFWLVRKYSLSNDSESKEKIRLPDSPPTEVNLTAKGKAVELYVKEQNQETRQEEIDLLNFDDANAERINQISLVDDSIKKKLANASPFFISVVDRGNQLKKSDKLIQEIDATLSRLRSIDAPGDLIEHLKKKREEVSTEARDTAKKRAEGVRDLTQALFP